MQPLCYLEVGRQNQIQTVKRFKWPDAWKEITPGGQRRQGPPSAGAARRRRRGPSVVTWTKCYAARTAPERFPPEPAASWGHPAKLAEPAPRASPYLQGKPRGAPTPSSLRPCAPPQPEAPQLPGVRAAAPAPSSAELRPLASLRACGAQSALGGTRFPSPGAGRDELALGEYRLPPEGKGGPGRNPTKGSSVPSQFGPHHAHKDGELSSRFPQSFPSASYWRTWVIRNPLADGGRVLPNADGKAVSVKRSAIK